jgi:hypothetical protein
VRFRDEYGSGEFEVMTRDQCPTVAIAPGAVGYDGWRVEVVAVDAAGVRGPPSALSDPQYTPVPEVGVVPGLALLWIGLLVLVRCRGVCDDAS